MTDIANTCPAAVIGRRIAIADEELFQMDERNAAAKSAGKDLEAKLTGEAVERLSDELENARYGLSFVRATSADGAAVQVAAAFYFINYMREIELHNKADIATNEAAIDRLLYSVIRHLQDRVEADCVTSGVEALASQMLDPWSGVDNRMNAHREIEEMAREVRQKVTAA